MPMRYYIYCLNNPLSYKDPNGNIAIVDDVTVAGIVVTAIATIALLQYM